MCLRNWFFRVFSELAQLVQTTKFRDVCLCPSPPWGRASDTDPGGTGTRQLQGAWARKRVFNTLTPGLYRHDVESGTTWAGVAAEKAKERYFVDGKKTNTIVVG